MALSATLSQKGQAPTRIHTPATVHFGPVTGGFAISRMELETEGQVPGIDAATFEQVAQAAKVECPVSKALAAVEVTLAAKLQQYSKLVLLPRNTSAALSRTSMRPV